MNQVEECRTPSPPTHGGYTQTVALKERDATSLSPLSPQQQVRSCVQKVEELVELQEEAGLALEAAESDYINHYSTERSKGEGNAVRVGELLVLQAQMRTRWEGAVHAALSEALRPFSLYYQWKSSIDAAAESDDDAVAEEEGGEEENENRTGGKRKKKKSETQVLYERAVQLQYQVNELLELEEEALHSIEAHNKSSASTHDSYDDGDEGAAAVNGCQVLSFLRELGDVSASLAHVLRQLQAALVELIAPQTPHRLTAPPAYPTSAAGCRSPLGTPAAVSPSSVMGDRTDITVSPLSPSPAVKQPFIAKGALSPIGLNTSGGGGSGEKLREASRSKSGTVCSSYSRKSLSPVTERIRTLKGKGAATVTVTAPAGCGNNSYLNYNGAYFLGNNSKTEKAVNSDKSGSEEVDMGYLQSYRSRWIAAETAAEESAKNTTAPSAAVVPCERTLIEELAQVVAQTSVPSSSSAEGKGSFEAEREGSAARAAAAAAAAAVGRTDDEGELLSSPSPVAAWRGFRLGGGQRRSNSDSTGRAGIPRSDVEERTVSRSPRSPSINKDAERLLGLVSTRLGSSNNEGTEDAEEAEEEPGPGHAPTLRFPSNADAKMYTTTLGGASNKQVGPRDGDGEEEEADVNITLSPPAVPVKEPSPSAVIESESTTTPPPPSQLSPQFLPLAPLNAATPVSTPAGEEDRWRTVVDEKETIILQLQERLILIQQQMDEMKEKEKESRLSVSSVSAKEQSTAPTKTPSPSAERSEKRDPSVSLSPPSPCTVALPTETPADTTRTPAGADRSELLAFREWVVQSIQESDKYYSASMAQLRRLLAQQTERIQELTVAATATVTANASTQEGNGPAGAGQQQRQQHTPTAKKASTMATVGSQTHTAEASTQVYEGKRDIKRKHRSRQHIPSSSSSSDSPSSSSSPSDSGSDSETPRKAAKNHGKCSGLRVRRVSELQEQLEREASRSRQLLQENMHLKKRARSLEAFLRAYDQQRKGGNETGSDSEEDTAALARSSSLYGRFRKSRAANGKTSCANNSRTSSPSSVGQNEQQQQHSLPPLGPRENQRSLSLGEVPSGRRDRPSRGGDDANVSLRTTISSIAPASSAPTYHPYFCAQPSVSSNGATTTQCSSFCMGGKGTSGLNESTRVSSGGHHVYYFQSGATTATTPNTASSLCCRGSAAGASFAVVKHHEGNDGEIFFDRDVAEKSWHRPVAQQASCAPTLAAAPPAQSHIYQQQQQQTSLSFASSRERSDSGSRIDLSSPPPRQRSQTRPDYGQCHSTPTAEESVSPLQRRRAGLEAQLSSLNAAIRQRQQQQHHQSTTSPFSAPPPLLQTPKRDKAVDNDLDVTISPMTVADNDSDNDFGGNNKNAQSHATKTVGAGEADDEDDVSRAIREAKSLLSSLSPNQSAAPSEARPWRCEGAISPHDRVISESSAPNPALSPYVVRSPCEPVSYSASKRISSGRSTSRDEARLFDPLADGEGRRSGDRHSARSVAESARERLLCDLMEEKESLQEQQHRIEQQIARVKAQQRQALLAMHNEIQTQIQAGSGHGNSAAKRKLEAEADKLKKSFATLREKFELSFNTLVAEKKSVEAKIETNKRHLVDLLQQ